MDMSILSKKIAKGAVIVFLGMFVSKALAYLYIALVARLGSSEYGLLSLALAVTSFISIFAILGLGKGITRYISYYKGKQDNQKIKGVIFSSLKLSLPVSLILMFLLFIFSEKISILVFHNIRLISILKLFSLMLPFISLSDIFFGVIIGFQKIEYKILTKEILESIIRLILTFIVIYLGYNLMGVIIIYIISIIITAILSFYFLQKKVFPFIRTRVVPKLLTKELFSFSYPLVFVGILTLVIKWTDIFMIGYFRTTSEVGIYNVVLPTANLLVIIPTALMALFIPIITEFYSKKKFKEIKKISILNSRWIFFINFPIFLLIFLFYKDILRIMFGYEYLIGGSTLLILSVGYMVHSLTHIHNSVFVMMGKTKLIFYLGLISAVFNVILNYFLIPRFGIMGGGISTSLSLILVYVLNSRINYKLTKIQPLKLNYLKPIIAGIISFIIIYYIINLIGNISFILFVLFSITFLVIYTLLVYLFRGWDKEDIDIIKAFYFRIKKLKMF